MKSLIVFLSLFFAQLAWAGDPGCTTATDVTAGDSYTAAASDCIIRVNVPFSHVAFEVNLPEDGNTFKVQQAADYAGDTCDYDDIDQIYICYPRAIEVYSLDRAHNTVGGAQSDTGVGMYVQGDFQYRISNTFTWDGSSNWGVDYDIWFP